MRYSPVTIFFSVLLLAGCAADTKTPSTASTLLWYEQPAREWIEALPLGNGRMGAMVFGGIEVERLLSLIHI